MKQSDYYQQALETGLASSPTEFWTKVRDSGLTAAVWICLASPSDDDCQCEYCGCRFGNHSDDCLNN